MTKNKANKVLFINLGQGGQFEKECIEQNQTLRLEYIEVDHNLCLAGRWDKVHDYFTIEENSKTFVATSHSNKMKQFYEEGKRTLWITFYAKKLWCFSIQEVTLLAEKTKTRPVIAYIANQHEHHSKKTFQEEYLAFLKKYNVEYDEKYVWD